MLCALPNAAGGADKVAPVLPTHIAWGARARARACGCACACAPRRARGAPLLQAVLLRGARAEGSLALAPLPPLRFLPLPSFCSKMLGAVEAAPSPTAHGSTTRSASNLRSKVGNVRTRMRCARAAAVARVRERCSCHARLGSGVQAVEELVGAEALLARGAARGLPDNIVWGGVQASSFSCLGSRPALK